MELISIIVPVYNVEKYLQQCLDSILAQTYQNWELLLVNDGSQDGSGAICDTYAAKDDRIKVYHEVNGGTAKARNKGISAAQGAYLTFIDSDDWIAETYLEELYQVAKAEGADIVMARYCRFVEATSNYLLFDVESRVKEITRQEYLDALMINMTDDYVITCVKLYSRHLFEGEYPIRYPEGRRTEDQYVSYLLALKSQKTLLLDKMLYCYRLRQGSASYDVHVIQHIKDDLDGHRQRLIDLALAGHDVTRAAAFLKTRLEAYCRSMEANGQTEDPLYADIKRMVALPNGTYR